MWYFCRLVSIKGYNSNLADVKFGVPQGSVLGPLLFLICINYLNQVLKICNFCHFSNEANLLHFSKSVKLDLKNLTYWKKKKKISLKVKKTVLVIFKHQKKKIDSPTKIKLNRERLYPSKSVKYLGIKIVGIKLKISSVIYHLKHIAQPKLKVYFLKNGLKTVNGEVERRKFN